MDGGHDQAVGRTQPQVLIDITLVEISKTEALNYDLNLIQSFPGLMATSGLTRRIISNVTSSDIINKLNKSGRGQFAGYQSNGGPVDFHARASFRLWEDFEWCNDLLAEY